MSKFVCNFKSKQYEKEISKINLEYKHSSTLKELYLRKLETSKEYEDAVDMLDTDINSAEGLDIIKFSDSSMLTDAYEQVLNVGRMFGSSLSSSSRLTNYRFYISQPYFDRNGSDPYPLYKLEDPRVSKISELVLKCIELVGIKDYDINLLNILVRIYRPGDILNFHTDREIFGENIYGLVLANNDKSRGLVLKFKKKSYMLEEEPGLIWKLSGKSRWEATHGYCTNFSNSSEFVRIAISFRFFENIKQIPKKPYES